MKSKNKKSLEYAKENIEKENQVFVIFCLFTKEIYKFLLCNDVAVKRNTGKII